jgi:hypothetical protein
MLPEGNESSAVASNGTADVSLKAPDAKQDQHFLWHQYVRRLG